MRRIPQLLCAASPARSIPSCLPTTASRFQQLQARTSPLFSIHAISSQTPLRNSSTSNSPFRLTTQPTPARTEPADPAEQQQSQPSHEFPEEPPSSSSEVYYSPYKPKRTWPPDMTKLSPKHQFRLERKYRRRAALKYARPKWTKATKLAQGGAIAFVIIYALLFMEWDERGATPIEEFRTYIFGSIKDAFSAPPSPASMRRPDRSVKD
ncbi:hypothetical protein ASPCAL02006 [Aspergillus calidoustus]|uniref:Uncharacterized protein n=1 Tax=Aspergillus calidoustus TaxID=454130 RepID=A0A0U5GP26_ASPCI|nr:hypothetical protein ASPCAL02006 [Aspergillus calidoustus]